jgi:hypothetical protein
MLLSGMEAEAPSTEHFEQRLIEAFRQPVGRSLEAAPAVAPAVTPVSLAVA